MIGKALRYVAADLLKLTLFGLMVSAFAMFVASLLAFPWQTAAVVVGGIAVWVTSVAATDSWA